MEQMAETRKPTVHVFFRATCLMKGFYHHNATSHFAANNNAPNPNLSSKQLDQRLNQPKGKSRSAIQGYYTHVHSSSSPFIALRANDNRFHPASDRIKLIPGTKQGHLPAGSKARGQNQSQLGSPHCNSRTFEQ